MSSQRLWAVSCLVCGLALALASRVPAAEEGDGEKAPPVDKTAAAQRDVGQGALRIVAEDGSIVECPLKHTDVQADVSGFVARVRVTQTFHNPTNEKIEAVYVFPLPHEAAVDSMTMKIGERNIVGVIKRRDEARRIYEQALMHGQSAALLEQERPNIFTQSVGNIEPQQEVKIEISYVDVLKYDMGEYEFHFPMVVGPRFIPGAPTSSPSPTPPELQGKVSPPVANTDRVPDAERISPPVLRPDVRNGHDISLTLSLDAGVPVQNLSVANHQADMQRDGDRRASVKLSPADSLPNKDFVLRYSVVGDKPEMAVLAHTGQYSRDADKLGRGYFMLMIQPQEDERLKKTPPREMVFLVDVSGSMRGAKTDKTRETMQNMLGLCRENDTVQVVTFAGRAQKLFDKPLPVDEASIGRALNFTAGLQGSGGTQMLEGVKLAIDAPIDKERVRIIVMLTDGFIGNEAEIIEHVGSHCGDQIRFWAIGIGQSPNMFLVDGVARQGGGMGKRLGLNDDAETLSTEVMTRIQRAQLANVSIDWGGLQVRETYPARIPELWAGRPVIVFGRYRDGGRHEITVSGTIEGEAARWPMNVELPAAEDQHDVLAKVWARKKIEDLMQQAFYADSPAVEEEVTALALDYRLMSQYTSFVAVDEQDADQLQPAAQPPRRMLVPVPLPEGAEWEGFFGGDKAEELADLELGARFRANWAFAADGASVLGRRGGAVRGRMLGAIGQNRRQVEARAYRLATTMSSLKRFESLAAAPAAGGRPGRPAPGGSSPRRAPVMLGQATTFDSFAATELAFERKARQASLNYAAAAQRPQIGPLVKAAQQTLQSAKEQRDAGEKSAARAAYTRACFLDSASANYLISDGQIAANALAALEEMHREQAADWTEQQPALGRRLQLVLRDLPIDEALQQVADAAGVAIRLEPGSVDDAKRLMRDDVRVSHLDLRGATAAQALDWILHPARLSWSLTGEQVVAGADRRLAGASAWVYDVSRIALPADQELDKDADKATAAVKQAADDFFGVVRSDLNIDDELDLVWFAPGQLLLFGDADRHQRAARLLAKLADPDRRNRLDGAAGELQAVTARRAEQSQELAAKESKARHRAGIAESHAQFGWQLLAAAADGRLDDEAVTELAIAWRDDATQELLAGRGRAIVTRSLWMVTEAARALPNERRLAALADNARQQARQAVADVVELVKEKPEDAEAFAALLYGALALRDDAELLTSARELLANTDSEESPLASARLIARSLLADRSQVDHAALSELVTAGVSGEDLVMLTALACRRAGGEAWQTFRAAAHQLLGSQPLPGHAVVAIHRLGQDRFSIARGQ